MDNISIGLLIAIIGCFIGLAGWLKSRDGKIAADSEWKGTVNTKLDIAIGVRKDYECLKTEVDTHGKEIVRLDQSTKALHHRLDEVVNRIE